VLAGKRIAILAEDDFEDLELIEPLRSMKNAGARVVIVGTGSKESYQGKRGNATISADIVRGRKVTSWPSIAVDLKNAGAEWVDAPVVQDGNLITSRKPADLPRFNKAIIEALRD